MKILFTGASSFTGFWFVKELIEEGHEIVVTFTGQDKENYKHIRKERIARIENNVKVFWNTKFGDENFLRILVTEKNIDLFCHHAAEVTNYKSENFNIENAINNNTRNLNYVLDILRSNGCNKIILTGSLFEQNEGAGSLPLVAFSPYGMSKNFTYEIFKYYSYLKNFQLGKFVIPNPFGPFEEQRFTYYLIKSWYDGKIPIINTPAYIRDNVHVTLLAKAYSYFIKKVFESKEQYLKINPSGFVGTQGEFAMEVAREMSKRLPVDCRLELKEQTVFSEPLARINTEPMIKYIQNWVEKLAWDQFADFYKNTIK